jgi:hypothetical protein
VSSVTIQDDVLLWGDLQLQGPVPVDATYEIDTMADGTNMGNPISIIEQVQAMAIDGALAARTGWDARTIPVRIRLAANDGEALAKAEAALTAQSLMDRPPPITWTPPLGESATAVFDVMVADLQRDTSDGWDFDEKYYGHRYFVLTLTCLPFARAMDTVTVPALAPPPTPGTATSTLIDECSSLTHWTKETNGASSFINHVDLPGSGVQVGAYMSRGTQYLRAVRTVATAMPAGQQYLAVDLQFISVPSGKAAGNWAGTVSASFDGVWFPAIGYSFDGEGGSRRYYFEPPASFTVAKFGMDYNDAWTNTSEPLLETVVYKIQATDTPGDPTTSTTRQQARLTNVYGAMPTRATIRLSDDTPAALGSTCIVYTSSNINWSPPLRQWLTDSGVVTADPTYRVSGGRHDLTVPSVFLIPARLLEAGAYSLVALMDCSAVETLTWQVRMLSATGAATIGSDRIQTGTVTVGAGGAGYKLVDIADGLILPPFEVETDDYAVELTLTGTSNMHFDEGWLFGLDNGALTIIDDLPNTGLVEVDWLEIRSPDLGAARPSIFGGAGAVGGLSACVDAYASAFGPHRFEPGPLMVFTMCTSSLVSQCELEYFPRFHSHPAADQSDPDTSGD